MKRDAQVARGILESDDAVDKLRNRIQQSVDRTDAAGSVNSIPRALDYLIIARKLERIADHATNIAEDVIFLAQGVDVRHRVALEPA